MNFLGIGFGELVLIAIVLLVVVGPERLPDLARQAGRLLVRGRNWLQSSPDAALVLRARQEIDQELALLKSSLLEVQSVRDEVLGAARQLNDVVAPLSGRRFDIDDLIGQPPAALSDAPANGQPAAPPELAVPPPPDLAALAEPPAPAPPAPALDRPAAAPATEVEQINLRLQAIMADLWALQEQLRQRGVLDADWQPPSFAMYLPDAPDAPPAARPDEVA